MSRQSAGLLMYRRRQGQTEMLLVHPGGPFWARKDLGVWSIPKGEFTEEAPLDAARREFQEETGFTACGDFHPLEPIRQAGGKIVHAWASKAIATPRRQGATPSRWNTHPTPAKCAPSPKWTEPPGSPFPKPAKRSSKASNPFSTSSNVCSQDEIGRTDLRPREGSGLQDVFWGRSANSL